MVVILDFTKYNQVETGNVHDFITVLSTGWIGPLNEDKEFKPNLQYVDFTEGYFNDYDEIIIWSDGGPAHFKVYKTHAWMPKFKKMIGKYVEWNNFLPHRGHNGADSHAGCGKVQVRNQEREFSLTRTIDNVESGISNLSSTTIIWLSAEEIHKNDDPTAKAAGVGWIKKFFHFTYLDNGIIECKELKNKGVYRRWKIIQAQKEITQSHDEHHENNQKTSQSNTEKQTSLPIHNPQPEQFDQK